METDLRELALFVVMQVVEEKAFLKDALSIQLERYQYLEKKERAFLARLSEGTVERLFTLDYVIGQYSKTKLSKMKPFIRNLLRLGAYQILYMEQIPDHAACNEAVKLAKKRKFVGLSGFVNGVLRSISRNKDQISYPEDKKEVLSVRYSVPAWLSSTWLSQYGEELTECMLSSLYEPRKLSVRVSEATYFPAFEKELEKNEIKVSKGQYSKKALLLENYDQIPLLPGYYEGKFYVQDESSILAVEMAAGLLGQVKSEGVSKESPFILDICAAPGGKSLYLAELFPKGKVLARDLTERKTQLISENKERLGLKNLQVQVWDGLVKDSELSEKADLVIADLPCSGLGVIRKKQDIKYHMDPEQMKELSSLQKELLKVAAGYVKPGGILLFSTCTVNTGENEENVEWFLKQHPQFSTAAIENLLPEQLREQVSSNHDVWRIPLEETTSGSAIRQLPTGNASLPGCLQLFPGKHGTDGFFFACFIRKE